MRKIQKLVNTIKLSMELSNVKTGVCCTMCGVMGFSLLSAPIVASAEVNYTEKVVFDISSSVRTFSSIEDAKNNSVEVTKDGNPDLFFVSPYTGADAVSIYKLPLDGKFYYHESSTPDKSYYNTRGWQVFKITEVYDGDTFKGYKLLVSVFEEDTLGNAASLGSSTSYVPSECYIGDLDNPVETIQAELKAIGITSPSNTVVTPPVVTPPVVVPPVVIPPVVIPPVVVPPVTVPETDPEQQDAISIRLGGLDRYETSIKIAQESLKGSKMKGVILASGLDFPDSLSASGLSAKYDAPIVLVAPSAVASKNVLNFIYKNLEVDGQVIIVGGEGVIDSSFESSLRQNGFNKIKRLGGIDRYATNRAIVSDLNPSKGGVLFLASSASYADALSISSVSAKTQSPIILTQNDISQATKNTIAGLAPSTVYIIGGTGVVSTATENYLKTKYHVVRLGGSDRYETSKLVYNKFKDSNVDSIFLASSNDFPDALSGSYLAYKNNSMILLVNSYKYTMYKDALSSKVKRFYPLGGSAVVPDKIVNYFME